MLGLYDLQECKILVYMVKDEVSYFIRERYVLFLKVIM